MAEPNLCKAYTTLEFLINEMVAVKPLITKEAINALEHCIDLSDTQSYLL